MNVSCRPVPEQDEDIGMAVFSGTLKTIGTK